MPLIIPSNSISAVGYEVDNSLRFNKASSDYLNYETGDTTTSETKSTLSAWVKRTAVGVNTVIFGHEESNSLRSAIYINDDDNFLYFQNSGNIFLTNAKFRDTSAWYHFVVTSDLTQATASDRVKLYINGVQETSFATESYPSQNASNSVPNFGNQTIGVNIYNSSPSSSNYFDGYMAEVCFIDGQALDPTSFRQFDEDSGIWKPKDVSGLSFGTNGFYLPFENSGALGQDDSGNGNNFTVNNLTSIDQTTDTPTNNYATMNPLDNFYYGATFSEGNLKLVQPSSTECYTTSTIGISSGKWYWEVKITSSGSNKEFVGIADKVSTASDFSPYSGNSQIISYYGFTGDSKAGSTTTNSSWGDTFTTGDIIGVALDLDNDKIYFSKNGTFQNSGDPTSGPTGTGALSVPTSPADGHWFAQFSNITNTGSTFEINFGNPTFSISSGNSDGNGMGNFEYAVPSGYYALNTKNLSEYG